MPEFLDRLSPQQAFWVVLTVCSAVVTVVFILCVAHYQLRYLADHTALTRERQDAEFKLKHELVQKARSAEELGQALNSLGMVALSNPDAPQPTAVAGMPEELLRAAVIKGIMRGFAEAGDDAPADAIESAVGLVNAADRATLVTLSHMVEEFVNMGVTGEQIVATVRAVCRTAPKPAPVPEPARRAEAAPAASGIDLQFAEALEK